MKIKVMCACGDEVTDTNMDTFDKLLEIEKILLGYGNTGFIGRGDVEHSVLLTPSILRGNSTLDNLSMLPFLLLK